MIECHIDATSPPQANDPPPGLDAFRRLVAGLGPRTLVRLESGRHQVGLDILYAVAVALDVPVAQLVTEAET